MTEAPRFLGYGLLGAPRHCLRGCKGHTLDLFRIILHHNCLDTLLGEIPVMYQHCCIFLHFITFLGQYRDFLNEILGHFPHFFHLVQMSHYWTFRAKLANTKSFVIFLSANIASRYYISLFSSMTGTIWLKINFKTYFSNSDKFWTLFWKAEVLFLVQNQFESSLSSNQFESNLRSKSIWNKS